jgi:hypothetical protein
MTAPVDSAMDSGFASRSQLDPYEDLQLVEYDSSATLVSDHSVSGLPSRAQYEQLEKEYLNNLVVHRRTKALISQELYSSITESLVDPSNTKIGTAQFRYWARKMFQLVVAGSNRTLLHAHRPVAARERIYDILCEAHLEVDHAGRDRTNAEVRAHYAWIPKELVAQFVAACPKCTGKRHGPFHALMEERTLTVSGAKSAKVTKSYGKKSGTKAKSSGRYPLRDITLNTIAIPVDIVPTTLASGSPSTAANSHELTTSDRPLANLPSGEPFSDFGEFPAFGASNVLDLHHSALRCSSPFRRQDATGEIRGRNWSTAGASASRGPASSPSPSDVFPSLRSVSREPGSFEFKAYSYDQAAREAHYEKNTTVDSNLTSFEQLSQKGLLSPFHETSRFFDSEEDTTLVCKTRSTFFVTPDTEKSALQSFQRFPIRLCDLSRDSAESSGPSLSYDHSTLPVSPVRNQSDFLYNGDMPSSPAFK